MKMVTNDQLDILRDIFSECDADWLLSHLSIKNEGARNFTIEVNNANWQDWTELFPDAEP
jgi:hypothetical protein